MRSSIARMKSFAKVVLALSLGFAWSYGFWFTIAAMSEAGHGWFGAVASIWCIFFLPLTGLAFVFRPVPWLRYVALYITLGCVLLDIVIGGKISSSGGRDGLGKVLEFGPEFFYTWAGLWFSWHAAIIVVWIKLLRGGEPSSQQGLAKSMSC
jgi:hypothetical protein